MRTIINTCLISGALIAASSILGCKTKEVEPNIVIKEKIVTIAGVNSVITVTNSVIEPQRGSALYAEISAMPISIAQKRPSTVDSHFLNLSNVVINQGQHPTCAVASMASIFKSIESCYNTSYFDLQYYYDQIRKTYRSNYLNSTATGLYTYDIVKYSKDIGFKNLMNPAKILSNEVRIDNFFKIHSNDLTKSESIIDNIKNHLHMNRHILFSVYMDDEMIETNSIWDDINSKNNQGGHILHIFGFNNDFFYVRNSWGTIYQNFTSPNLKISSRKLLNNITAAYAISISPYCSISSTTSPMIVPPIVVSPTVTSPVVVVPPVTTTSPLPVTQEDLSLFDTSFDFGINDISKILTISNFNSTSINVTVSIVGSGFFLSQTSFITNNASPYYLNIYFGGASSEVDYNATLYLNYVLNGINKTKSISLTKAAAVVTPTPVPVPVLINTSPAVGSYSSPASSYSCNMTFLNHVRYNVLSINGDILTLRVAKVDATPFSKPGTIYLKSNDLCGVPFASQAFNSGESYVDVVLDISNHRNTTLGVTITSTSYDRFNLGGLTIY